MRYLLLLLAVACGGSSNSSAPGSGGTNQGLVVQPTSAQSLAIPAPGGTLQLAAYQRDTDPYGGGGLLPVTAAWSSSMTSVASVDQKGLVTAMASGSAVITATTAGATGTATVTVGSMMSKSAGDH